MDKNIEIENQQQNEEIKATEVNEAAEQTTKKPFPKWIIAAAVAVVAIIIAAAVIFMPRHEDYTVKIVDEVGNPVSSVMVTITDRKGEAKTKMTDDDGMAQFTDVLVGDNTVTLDVSHREIMNLSKITLLNSTYTLERKTRELRAVVRDDTKIMEIYGVVEDGTIAYSITAGEYEVFTRAGKTSYVVFNAHQSGVYKVSFVSDDAEMTVGHYGIPMFVQSTHCGDLDYDGKSFELIIHDTATPYVIGVNCVNTADTVLTIERVDDAPFDPQYAPWTSVEATEEFVQFTLPVGKKLKDIDITDPSVSVVLGEDGYYYTANGKPVYIRIGSVCDARYLDVSIAYIAGLVDKNFGQNFGGYVYDENGEFVGKYSYNEMLKAYFGYVDDDNVQHTGYCDANGVYPLTAELAEAIKVHGNSVGWWNPNSGNYLFAGVPVVKDNLWLFLCCTAE